jgi:hypothetical protein
MDDAMLAGLAGRSAEADLSGETESSLVTGFGARAPRFPAGRDS